MKQVTRILAGLAAVAAVLGASPAAAQAQQAQAQQAQAQQAPAGQLARPDLVLRGDARCTRCHDAEDSPQVLQIGSTRHGMKADDRTPTCTSCHGESTAHVDRLGGGARPKPDRNFKRNNEQTPPEVQNEACLTCHQGGTRVHWQGSGHSRSQLACASCHTIHAARDQVLVKATQAGVCFTCHQDKRADMFRFSTHPVRTGWMSCSSCHAPHGSPSDFNLIRNTVNETCYTCHADKRGPFLWEHPPVRENCGECHNPHGSNNSHLLKVRGPYLCQQCHIAPQHPSGFYDGRGIPQGQPPGGNFSRMLGQNCANCHSKVHGSNHPSGVRFTR